MNRNKPWGRRAGEVIWRRVPAAPRMAAPHGKAVRLGVSIGRLYARQPLS
ncbi:hypothetical protein ACFSHT_35355 [Paraburkholderia silviterrae]|nr:hypothetical protein [Paraburkholderia silviterrae]